MRTRPTSRAATLLLGTDAEHDVQVRARNEHLVDPDPFPAPGAIIASAVYYPPTNKVFVFGGEDAVSGQNYNTTRIYDVATNAWSTGAPLPDVRSFAASGYNPGNQRIYVVAGYKGQVTRPRTRSTSTTRPPTPGRPRPRSRTPSAGPAGISGGRMIVARGRDATNR